MRRQSYDYFFLHLHHNDFIISYPQKYSRNIVARWIIKLKTWVLNINVPLKMTAQSAGAVEYTDCISAEG